MSGVAIITARGGSKRIPGKNIKEFCGKPIIAYSIEAALESRIYDEVMVSTDSEEIAETAKTYGASVPFYRSPETSNDFATSADVIEEVLRKYQETGRAFDFFTCIYPTAPFITAKKLTQAKSYLDTVANADGVVSVVRFSFPPQRALRIVDGCLSYQHPEYQNSRSQDLEALYHDCGQFYFCRTEPFMKHHSLFLPNSAAYIMKEEEVQDIDNMSDWIIAEQKYKALQQQEH